MRSHVRTALVVIASALFAATGAPRACASSGERVDVVCPICERKVEGWVFNSSNNFGGTDRDFCEHAAGGSPFLLSAWTCPKCHYTGTSDDWDRTKLPASLIERLRKDSPLRPGAPIDPTATQGTASPAWVRWDLLLQVLELRDDATLLRRADAALRTAWTQRFDFAWPEGLAGVGDVEHHYVSAARAKPDRNRYEAETEAAAALVADADRESTPLTATERRHRLRAAAHLWKARGEDPDASRVLARLRRAPDPRQAPEAAWVGDLEARIARERDYLGRAVALFERAVREKTVPADQTTPVRYLIGEIHRRRGDSVAAETWLQPIADDGTAPEWIRGWARDAIRRVAPGEASSR